MVVAACGRIFGTTRGAFEDFRVGVATARTPRFTSALVGLDLESGELFQLADWLAQAKAPRPEGSGCRSEGKFGPLGCKTFHWRGERFSVICFYDQRNRGVHLFSISARSLRNPPPEGAPQRFPLGGLPTATWSRGGNSFDLVAGTPGLDLGELF